MGLEARSLRDDQSPDSQLDLAWANFYEARALERDRRRHLCEVIEMHDAALSDHSDSESQLRDAFSRLALLFRRVTGQELPTVGIHTLTRAHVDDRS